MSCFFRSILVGFCIDVGAAAYSETDVSTDSQAIDDDEHDGTHSLMASPTQQGAAAADGTIVRRQPLMPPLMPPMGVRSSRNSQKLLTGYF
jgi:hypothetical protein